MDKSTRNIPQSGLKRDIVESTIQKLQNSDMETIDIDELYNIVAPMFHGYVFKTAGIPAGAYISRGRKVNTRPSKKKELSYPDPEYIKELGRCNNIGVPFFYGSINRHVPFNEVGAEVGDYAIIALWKTTQSLQLNHVGYTESGAKTLGTNRNLNEDIPTAGETIALDDLTAEFYRYISDVFTRNVPDGQKYLYKLSIVMTRFLMDKDKVHGLRYPSVAYSGNSDNILLTTNFADTLEFIAVEYVQIIEQKGHDFYYNVLDTADTIIDEEIKWTGKRLNFPLGLHKKGEMPRDQETWSSWDGKVIERTSTGPTIINSKLSHQFENEYYREFRDSFYYRFSSLKPDISETDKTLVEVYINFDFMNKEYSLSFYVPVTDDPVGNTEEMLNYHLDVIDRHLKKNQPIKIRFKSGTAAETILTSKDSSFNHKITIYSELKFDSQIFMEGKPPEYELNFIFGTDL
jgi:hypothetical protein